MKWGQAAGLALGVMKLVDLTKETLLTAGTPPEWSKSLLAISLAAAGSTLLEDDWNERVLTTVAVAGLASSMHEAYALVTTMSDRNKTRVLAGGAEQVRAAAMSPRRVQGP